MKRVPWSADLIADIYEAAVDDERWPDFSKLLGAAARIEHMGVWIIDSGQIVDISLAEIWRPLGKTYQQRFSNIDPWAGSLARAPLETVMLGYEHLREDELVKTEFYNDFARVGGMFRPMGVKMQLAPDVFATVGSDQPWSKLRFDQSDKPRLQRLIPYVKHALQLRRRLHGLQVRSGNQEAVLDSLAFAIIVCTAGGRVMYANAAATALARNDGGIAFGRHGSGIRTHLAGETKELTRLIHDAASGGAGGAIRLTGRNGEIALLGLVTPLPHSLNSGSGAGNALVSLRSARDSPSFTQASLVALLGLSPAQAAIALAIFNNKSPEEIAAERGVAISTLRTHLAEIFARTGAENQRDLVRLLGTLPPVRAQSA
jgi:DNA-binding CsgD family transcriptional regulator/PAS domain-containing protein